MSSQFPLVLNTDRVSGHRHTRTKTGQVAKLNKLNPAPFISAHPDDAAALGLADGDAVQIVSRHGFARSRLKIDSAVRAGTLFMPFHWGQEYDSDGCVNTVTLGENDPLSRQPELKFSAVRLEKFCA